MTGRPRFATKRELIGWLRSPVQEGDAPLNRYLRELYGGRRDARDAFGDLRGDSATRFLSWAMLEIKPPSELLPPTQGIELLNAPARSGARWGITRLLEYLHSSRLDLKRAFRDMDGEDGARYIVWMLRCGCREHGLPEQVVPQPRWLRDPAALGQPWGINRFLEIFHADQPAVRDAFPDLGGRDGARFVEWARTDGVSGGEIPPSLVPPRRAHPRAIGPAVRGRLRRARRALRTGRSTSSATVDGGPEPPWGVNVLGFLRSEIGIGEGVRLLATGLERAGVPVMRWPCGDRLIEMREGASVAASKRPDPAADPYAFNLVGINGPELPWVSSELEAFGDRYTIGCWWWEVHGALPDSWFPGCLRVDEVWAATTHVARGLEPFVPVPVTTIKLPVVPPAARSVPRADLGFPEGYVFLFMFDYFSSLERKNPIAVIEAFRRAFPAGSGAKLVIKSINGAGAEAKRELVRDAIGGHPDIELIEGLVSRETKDAMIAACDCYVSLHRAEGFGIPLAEAMSIGKPVIATGYSGNLDFMDSDNGYLVDAALTRVGDRSAHYPSEATWAEPDIDHAAELMTRVFERPEEARARGARAAADIARRHSPRAAGNDMLRRLEQLGTRIDGAGRRSRAT